MSKSINNNKQFMIVTGLLAIGVFFIVFLFLYLAYRFQSKNLNVSVFQDHYTIQVDSCFTGDSIAIYINDSLIINQTIDNVHSIYQVKRFAEESMLMVVDNKTDQATPFNLAPKGSFIHIQRQENGTILIKEEPIEK